MARDDIYPLRLEPLFSPRVWGGDRLPALLGRAMPPLPSAGEPIGESWMVYQDNLVINGAFAGKTLGDVAARLGARLVGYRSAARYGDRVPLLAKFIDAKAALSVQVHPDDAFALEHERASGHLGKSEAWYVLDAAPDAAVLWGFRRDETAASIRRAVADGTLERLMNRVPVAAGDVIHNPAGTVHAILPGILLFEIQQSSDLTYRLYDYGRLGADGRPRPLHLERALEVADLRGGERARVAPVELPDGWVRRVASPHFVLDTRVLRDGAGAGAGSARRRARARDAATSPDSLQLLQLVRGQAWLAWEGGREALEVGTALVLPAALGGYAVEGEGELIRCAVVPPPLGAPG